MSCKCFCRRTTPRVVNDVHAVQVSISPLRVQEIAFLASFVHKHTLSCTGCKLRGQEGVLHYLVVH